MSTVTVSYDPRFMLIVYASDVTEEERGRARPLHTPKFTKFSYRELQAALVGAAGLRPPPKNAKAAAKLNVGGRPPAATADAAAAAWPVWREPGRFSPFANYRSVTALQVGEFAEDAILNLDLSGLMVLLQTALNTSEGFWVAQDIKKVVFQRWLCRKMFVICLFETFGECGTLQLGGLR